VLLEIWSDVVCPWCAIGRAHLREALASFPHADEVELRWRSFELDPTAPAVREGDLVDHLAGKYRTPPAEAQGMIDQMTERAAGLGVTFRLDRARGGNTFDAHRLLHLAADVGLQDQVKDRFLTGYLADGVAVGDPAELRTLAVDAGLDATAVDEVLAGDRYATEVRADEEQAHAYGISGVPFFVFDRRFAVAGAQPAAALRQALDQAWASRSPLTVLAGGGPTDAAHDPHEHDPGSDDACADGSCAI
jgi:predicted DsbA family dithiol-disulfide isomerase